MPHLTCICACMCNTETDARWPGPGGGGVPCRWACVAWHAQQVQQRTFVLQNVTVTVTARTSRCAAGASDCQLLSPCLPYSHAPGPAATTPSNNSMRHAGQQTVARGCTAATGTSWIPSKAPRQTALRGSNQVPPGLLLASLLIGRTLATQHTCRPATRGARNFLGTARSGCASMTRTHCFMLHVPCLFARPSLTCFSVAVLPTSPHASDR